MKVRFIDLWILDRPGRFIDLNDTVRRKKELLLFIDPLLYTLILVKDVKVVGK